MFAAIALLWTYPAPSEACGVFARRLPPEQRPSLSREKALLVYDADKKREHFVREVTFARAGDPLGFVVPVPTKPEIASISDNRLFTFLRQSFRYRDPKPSESGYGRGAGAGFGGSGVQVLEIKRVGSFKAFVLTASDESALAKWLADNGFDASEGGKAWLQHYVVSGFYYVALRYEPKTLSKKDKDKHPIAAETIRISFDTPVPYYPYLEPIQPKLPRDSPRLLELWYVSNSPVVPVARHEDEDGGARWVRPLRGGAVVEDQYEVLPDVSKELVPLLPAGKLVVQAFQDQKRVRDGFSDMLFVPKEATELTDERKAELESFLAILDPTLRKGAK